MGKFRLEDAPMDDLNEHIWERMRPLHYSVAGTDIITASIDASEEWDIAMVDLSGALLQSKQEGILSVRLEVIMVRLLQ